MISARAEDELPDILYRLTYGATLAELTSLEEMMRILMDDNQVHNDVINKLWQVYGTSRNSSDA